MPDVLINISVAVGALIVGNLVTRWWDRARPLVVLTAFSEITKSSDRVQCDKELHDLTKQSFVMQAISEGEVRFGEISSAYVAAKRDLDLTDNIETWVKDAIKALMEASNDREKIEAIKSILRWDGLRQLVELIFYRDLGSELTSNVSRDDKEKLLVLYSDKKKEGTMVVVFPDSLGYIGANLSHDEWKRKAIEPLGACRRTSCQKKITSIDASESTISGQVGV